jgi:methylthioribose-1-phosphate isomerase
VYRKCKTYTDVIKAIKNMIVRGAPAIGVSAAYGMVLAGTKAAKLSPTEKIKFIKKVSEEMIQARPTAVNLKWAVDKMCVVVESSLKLNPENFVAALESAANEIYDEDIDYG